MLDVFLRCLVLLSGLGFKTDVLRTQSGSCETLKGVHPLSLAGGPPGRAASGEDPVSPSWGLSQVGQILQRRSLQSPAW